MTNSPPGGLPGNRLSAADSDFETATGLTWTSLSNATITGRSTSYSFVGSYSFLWSATAAGDTQITTGYYPCLPSDGYVFSGYLNTVSALHDCYIGVNWYTSSHTLINGGGVIVGPDNPSTIINGWQPIYAGLSSPANAAYYEVVVWVATSVGSGEQFAIDLMFASNPPAQVLIDWSNSTFATGSSAGNDFTDMTPWVRYDSNLTMTRGRQEAISEVQAGQASFDVQNDLGWFTPQLSTSPYYGGITLGRRVQVNVPDESGNWIPRFDGYISQITYDTEPTGNTMLAHVSASDVLAWMNRQDTLNCWTMEQILSDQPMLFWPLNDQGNTITAQECSGNTGPTMRLVDCAYNVSYSTQSPAMAWRSSTGGVETLADAVAVGKPDGSEYWLPGSTTPSNLIRGLDSGAVGPYNTPLGCVYFTPGLGTESVTNFFAGTDGYQLQAELYQNGIPITLDTGNANATYTIECWFMPDPGIWSSGILNGHYGPYTILSLGSSRQGNNLNIGLYNGSSITFEAATYSYPPAYPAKNYNAAPSALATSTTSFGTETVARPHHLVIEIQGASPSGTATFYLDGNQLTNTITLPTRMVIDTITVGGAFGGHGNFWGGISCLSLYNYLLSQGQINTHCMMGQYGMWEQPTDNCVATIANLAGIPPFWNHLTGEGYGLTLTEYMDITGASPLSAMQSYEQAERGLLYVNSSGQLTFHTRDWRMGYGAPDITFQPSIYNPDLSYGLVDTYLLNEAATATQVFTTGVDWSNSNSQQNYGTYANGTATSPIQLPLITWSRAYAVLGLSQYVYFPDPNLNDNSAWQINTRNTPYLIPASLTVDILTFESSAAGGIHQSDIYDIDIDNMVTIAGPPSQFPDQSGMMDFFVEGINEVIGIGQHTLTFYTSPANLQRAWKPGDSNYGILGTNTRLGISAPDTNLPCALGKSVSHDAGLPYWPPQFNSAVYTWDLGWANVTATQNFNIPINDNLSSGLGDCILVQIMAAAAATITISDTQGNTYNQVGSTVAIGTNAKMYLFAAFNCIPLACNGNDHISVATNTSQTYCCGAMDIHGVSAVDGSGWTATGTSTTPSITLGTLSSAPEMELVAFGNASGIISVGTPGGWTQCSHNNNGTLMSPMFWNMASTTSGDTASTTWTSSCLWGAIGLAFTLAPYSMNNPANNGHNFMGELDIRGMRDNIQQTLQPPMCVIGLGNNHTTSYSSGNQGVNNNAVWDTVYIDTTGGMSLTPMWPNWYTVTVPGFYEITASFPWQTQSSGSAGVRCAWIIVAQGAAQKSGGSNGPYASGEMYATPIGEQTPPNSVSYSPTNCPCTRLYCGVGDMINIGVMHTQGSAITNATGVNCYMSIRWLGYNNYADQYPNAGVPGGGTYNGPPVKQQQYTKSWYPTHTYSYYWSPYNLRQTDGYMWQGAYSGAPGPQWSFALYPYSTIKSTLSGATLNKCMLSGTNLHSWYYSGAIWQVGCGWATSYGSTFDPYSVEDIFDCKNISFKEGQTLTNVDIGTWFAWEFQNGNATSLTFGNGSYDLTYYGYWQGGTSGNAPKLTIVYTK